MTKKVVKYSAHAEKRMFERGISKAEVEKTIEEWEVIETNTEMKSYLLWGKKNDLFVHVVCIDERINYYVVSVYRPSKSYFSEESGYKKRIN